MKNVFELGHVALYAKGHYMTYKNPKSTHSNIVEDLIALINADGYCADVMTLKNMGELLINKCKVLDVVAFKDLLVFAKGISPRNGHLNGYVQEDSTYNMYLAIIHYCLSNIMMLEREQFVEVEPDYENVLPKKLN